MDNATPSTWAMLAGGAVLFIATFLDWQSFGGFGTNAWDRGILGLFLIVIAGIAIAVAVIQAFAPQVQLPQEILTFTPTQAATALGAASFLISFGLLFQFEGFAIGSILAVLGSAAIVVGGVLDQGAVGNEPPRTI